MNEAQANDMLHYLELIARRLDLIHDLMPRPQQPILVEGQVVDTYRGYPITVAPAFQREYRFNFCHPDYDGPEDKRCGFAPTVQGCREQIDELEGES